MSRMLSALAKHRKAAGAGIASVAAVAALALATFTTATAYGVSLDGRNTFPEGTTAIADGNTSMTYTSFPVPGAYDVTDYAGSLWTDKTVYVPDGTGTTENTVVIPLSSGSVEADKTESGVFLTEISALSSSLSTELVEPVPLDIVMVLDVSGSMQTFNGYSEPVTSAPTSVRDDNPSDKYYNDRYFICEDGVYKQIRHTDTENGVRYYDRVDNGTYLRYYFTSDPSLDGAPYNNNPDYRYALLYRRNQNPQRIDDLKTATINFLNTIARNNTSLANLGYSTDSMSQVAMVTFSGPYGNQPTGTWNNNGSYSPTGSDLQALGYDRPDKTNVVTPFTTYTSAGANIDGTADVTYAQNVVSGENGAGGGGFTAKNATAADYGMTLASELFAGHITLANNFSNSNRAGTTAGISFSGRRSNAKQVVIFFTDGNPKHNRGSAPNDFSGMFAQNTMDIARQLKDDGVLVYTVAVIDGADPDDLSLNVNIYLNGVSSNYPNAYATNGSDGTTVSGFVPPASNVWTVNPSEWEGSNQGYYLVVGGDMTISDAFAQIAKNITEGGGEDTTTTGRDGNTAVTITDYLGDYMEFKGLNGIVYGATREAVVIGDNTYFVKNGTVTVNNQRYTVTYTTENDVTVGTVEIGGVTYTTSEIYDVNLYAPGTQEANHIQAQVQRDDTSATDSTYTMWYTAGVPSALLNPPEGEELVDLNLITVQVSRSTDPKTGDTVTIKIPPELIPATRYDVHQQLDNNGTVKTSVTRSDVDPIRILYSVGPKASTEANVIGQLETQALRAEDATNEVDAQTEAYRNFMNVVAEDGSDGIYHLYNNLPPANSSNNGTTTVDLVLSTEDPATTNPFYFYVDEPLWVAVATGGYRKATPADLAAGTQLYTRVRTFSLAGGGTETTQAVAWDNTDAIVTGEDGILYVAPGTARTDVAGANTTTPKAEGANVTETAVNALVSVFDPQEMDVTGEKHVAHQYLGDNGRIDMPVYGTLAVTKAFTTGEGFTLPENPEATFTVNFYAADGSALQGTYPALIRNSGGHPVNHTTHEQVNGTAAGTDPSMGCLFSLSNGSTFTLRDGETLKVTGLPDGATYKVIEAGMQGFAATVTNNDDSLESFSRGASSNTAAADQQTGLSTIHMACTEKVVFTNDYTPDPVEVIIPTGLVTKQLTGDQGLALSAGDYEFGIYENTGFAMADDGTVTGTRVAFGTNLADNVDGLVYQAVATPAEDELTTYYELVGDNYLLTKDIALDSEKTYYTITSETMGADDPRSTNRLADVSWTNDVNSETGTSYLTFDHPTPDGTPSLYTIVEYRTDPITGVAYATNTYQLRVTVKAVSGKLVPSYAVYAGSTRLYSTDEDPLNRQVTFSNSYTPNGTLSSPTDDGQGITLLKSLTGRSLRDGEFSYSLYEAQIKANGLNVEHGAYATIDGTVYLVDNNNSVVVGGTSYPVRNDAVEINSITYPVVYGYYVTDSGTVKAATLSGDQVTIDGTAYDAEYSIDSETAPVARGITGNGDEKGTITIAQIPFNHTIDYKYILVEDGNDGDDGLYYDHSQLLATAHVSLDVENAQLMVDWSVSEPSGWHDSESPSMIAEGELRTTTDNDDLEDGKGTYTFDNEYAPDPAHENGIEITKVLTGRDWIDRDVFQIKVEAEEGAPELHFGKMVNGQGQIVDQAQPDVKTFEHEEGSTTYVYSLTDETIDNQATFIPGALDITAEDMLDVEEKTGTDSLGNTVTYKEKSWTYAITEIAGEAGGVAYDSHTATVTVTATDNLNGHITITYEISGSTTFRNVYTTTLNVTPPFEVTKTVEGHKLVRASADQGTFGVRIWTTDADTQLKIGDVSDIQSTNHVETAAGEPGLYDFSNIAAFNTLRFSEADLEGEETQADGSRTKTYVFQAQEAKDLSRTEYTYDETIYTVTILLTDDGQGHLSVETTVTKPAVGGGTPTVVSKGYQGVEGHENSIANFGFVNTYHASGELQLDIAKTLNGRDAHAGEFGFTLTQVANGTATADDEYTGTTEWFKTNADGARNTATTVPFANLVYSIDELENMVRHGYAVKTVSASGNAEYTLKYSVSEADTFAVGAGTFPNSTVRKDGKRLADNGITQGTSEFEFTVTITDDGRGNLTATPSYGTAGIDFVNTYKASGMAILQVQKTFSADSQTLKDAVGIIIGNNAYVVDNGNIRIGGVDYPVNAETGTVTIGGTTYTVDSIFRFDLNTDETGAHLPALTQVRNEVPTDLSNNAYATFGVVTFTQDDVRSAPYVYVVTENQQAQASGYTYSPAVKLVMPVLVDNEDGTLSMRTGIGSDELFNISGEQTSHANAHYVTISTDDGEVTALRLEPISHDISFLNEYHTDYTTQTITATKLMPEGGLASKLFTFVLVPGMAKDADGNPAGTSPFVNPVEDGNIALTNAETQSVYLYSWGEDGVPLPEVGIQSTVTTDDTDVTSDEDWADKADYMVAQNNFSSVNFGNFRFTQAGTYTYEMYEFIDPSALGEINTTASTADYATKVYLEGTETQATYAQRDQLSASDKANAGLVWRYGDYLYDDNHYLVTIKVVDHGDGQLSVDEVVYTPMGTTVAPTVSPSTYLEPRFLNHNTFRASDGIAIVTISKQLLNRNFWVNQTGDDAVTSRFNYFPAIDLPNETYAFTIDALGQASDTSYTGDSITNYESNGLPAWREVQATITIASGDGSSSNTYPIYDITYTRIDESAGSDSGSMRAYYDKGQGLYVQVEKAGNDYVVPSDAKSIRDIDYAINTRTEVGVGTDIPAPIPMPSHEASGPFAMIDHWPDEDFLALVSADTSDTSLGALTQATISRDFQLLVDYDSLIATSTGMYRADFYYHMYETAPNDSTITFDEPITINGREYVGTYVLRTGSDSNTDFVKVSNPVADDLGSYYEYSNGSYVLTGDTTIDPAKSYFVHDPSVYPGSDYSFNVDPEIQAKLASGEYKPADGDLRAFVSENPDYKWTYRGVEYQTNSYYIRVTVTSSHNSGSLLASVSYSDGTIDPGSGAMVFTTGGAAVPIFANNYKAIGLARVEVTKSLLDYLWADTDWSEDDKGFTFELAPLGDAPMPTDDEGNEVNSITITREDWEALDDDTATDVRKAFPDIVYDLTKLRQAPTNGIASGDFIYELREVSDGVGEAERGLAYDGATIYVRVHAEDNMDGTLATTVTYHTAPSCTPANELKITRGTTVTSSTIYEPTTDTAVDEDKAYYVQEGDAYVRVANPYKDPSAAEDAVLGYYEQVGPGATFTNVGFTELMVEKRWDGVAIANSTVRVIYAEVPEAVYTAANSWIDVPGWEKMTDTGWDASKAEEGDYAWSFYSNETHTFSRNATTAELTHLFEDLPVRNPETGNYYVYGIYEDSNESFEPTYSYDSENDKTIVTNKSKYESEGIATVNVVKELDGRGWIASDEFVYQIVPVTEDAPMPREKVADSEGREPGDEGYVPTYAEDVADTASAVSNHGAISYTQRQATFEDIQFTHDMLTRQDDGSWTSDFEYTISEQVGDTGYTVAQLAEMEEDELPEGVIEATWFSNGVSKPSFAYKGVTYDPSVHTVRIHVEDDTNGEIHATLFFDGATTSTAVPVFVNTYEADGILNAYIVKHLEGRDWAEGDAFRYYMRKVGTAGTWLSVGPVTEASPAINEGGDRAVLAFRDTFTADQLSSGTFSATFVYEITEVREAIAGVTIDPTLTYDTTTYYMKVVVTDNGDGTLKAEPTYWLDASCTKPATTASFGIDDDGDPIAFNSEEEPVATVKAPITTNTYELITVSGTKTWVDGEDELGTRPSSITVSLLANGDTVDTADVTAGDDGSWTYSFADLPKLDANGNEIAYTVAENEVDSYTTSIDGYNITNALTMDIDVIKVWNDGDTEEAKAARPESVTVNLIANGQVVETKTIETNSLTPLAHFENLPLYDADGNIIAYTVEEVPVEGYVATVTKFAETNPTSDVFTVTNTPTVTPSGVKTWVDESKSTRPDSITVKLQSTTVAEPEEGDWEDVAEATVIVTPAADGGWTYSFADQPAFDAEGNEISYRVVEDPVPAGYAVSYDSTHMDITNTLTETTTHTVVKKWVDNANPDVPEELVIKLKAGDEVVDTATITADDDWTCTFENLPILDEDGNTITYSAVEDPVPDGYAATTFTFGDTTIITNVFEGTGTVDVSVEKTWDDNGDEAGLRPDEIVFDLYADGVKTDTTLTLPENDASDADDDIWEGVIEELPRFDENGSEIAYQLVELPVSGYSTVYDSRTVDDNGNVSYEVTNARAFESVVLSGQKLWQDDDDKFGERPRSITLNVLANGEAYTPERADEPLTITVTGDGNVWTYETPELPRYIDGEEVAWSVEEEERKGYICTTLDSTVTGVVGDDELATQTAPIFINTLDPIDLTVAKIWDDSNDQDGFRPSYVDVGLFKVIDDEDILVENLTLTEEGNWSATITGLPEYNADGGEIVYKLVEEPVEHYNDDNEPEYEGEVEDGRVVITNTHVPELTHIDVTKVWDDDDDEAELRPESVTIELTANGAVADTLELSADDALEDDENTWAGTFENLPAFDRGEEIEYDVREVELDDYESVVDGDAEEGFTITNTLTTEAVSVTPQVTKHVTGGKATDAEFTFELKDDEGESIQTVSTDGSFDGTGTDDQTLDFDEISLIKPGTYTYTVEETYEDEDVPENWTYASGSQTITIEVVRLADGSLDARVTGNNPTFTNVYGDVEAVEMPLKASKKLTGRDFVEGDAFTFAITAADGTPMPVNTTVTINPTSGSTAIVDFGTVTYTLANAGRTYEYTIKETAGNQSGITYDESTQTLYVKVVDEDGTLVVTYSTDGETFSANTQDAPFAWPEFENVYDASGTVTPEVTKQLKGDQPLAAEQFSFEIEAVTEGAPMPASTIAKNNGEGKVTFGTIAYTLDDVGKTYEYKIHEVIPAGATADNSYTLDGVIYDAHEVTLTVVVTDNNDGTVSAEATYSTADGGTTFTNSVEGAGVNITVTKKWDDGNDQDGLRPDEITVCLMKGESDTELAAAKLNAGNNWTYTFTDLPIYDSDGVEIVYTLEEIEVNGYDVEIVGSMEDGFTVTNTHEPGTITVDATKEWDDDDNTLGIRDDVTLHLIGTVDGTVVYYDATGKTIAADATGDDLTVTWANVPEKIGGEDVSYTVVEDALFGYTPEIEQLENDSADDTGLHFSVTNTLTTTPVEVSVTKQWNDADNQDGKRPSEITFQLLQKVGTAEPTVFDEQTVTADEETGEMSYTWTDLVFVAEVDGQTVPVLYSVDEVWEAETTGDEGESSDDLKSLGYEEPLVVTTAPGEFTIVNTYEPETIEISASKAWSDNNDAAGSRPDHVIFHLVDADDTEVGEAKTVFGNDTATWTDVPRYKDGEEVAYTVTEDSVPNYTSAIVDNGDGTFTVTNTYNALMEVKVVKAWFDADGNPVVVAPTEVTVHLYKRVGNYADTEVASYTFPQGAAADQLEYSFGMLPTVENDLDVVYHVEEDEVEDYKPTYLDGTLEDGVLTLTVENHPYKPPVNPPKEYVTYVDQLNEPGSQVLLYEEGSEASEVPSDPDHTADGFSFQQWDKNESVIYDEEGNEVSKLTTYVARFQDTHAGEKTVTYVDGQADGDSKIVKSEITTDPSSVTPPDGTPSSENMAFDGWSGPYYDAAGNVIYVATYKSACPYNPGGRCFIDPPVRKDIAGNPTTSPTFTFVLEAVTDGAPMPKGSSNGTKSVSFAGAGSVEFGIIEYTAPGEYFYKIYEVNNNTSADWAYDEVEYGVHVVVTEGEDGELTEQTTYTRDGIPVEEATTLVLTNTYKDAPKPPSPTPVTPKTGDATPQVALLVAAAAAVLALGSVIRRKHG